MYKRKHTSGEQNNVNAFGFGNQSGVFINITWLVFKLWRNEKLISRHISHRKTYHDGIQGMKNKLNKKRKSFERAVLCFAENYL